MTTMQTKLNSEEISAIIRGVVGEYDDTFQDVWVAVLERRLNDPEEIKRVAAEIHRKAASKAVGDKFNTVDGDAPLFNKKNDETNISRLDLQDSDMDNPDNIPEAESQVIRPPSWKVTDNVYLDKETADMLRSRFPAVVLRDSVRLALGLKPLGIQWKRVKVWQPWEDEILREYFPNGGYDAVKDRVNNRTADAVRGRVSKLKIRFNSYNPLPDYFNRVRLEKEVGISYHWLRLIEKAGYLVPKAASFNGRPMNFYQKKQVIEFLKTKPFCYPHWLIKPSYQEYVPTYVKRWLPIDVVWKRYIVSKGTINQRIKAGYLVRKKIGPYSVVDCEQAKKVCSQTFYPATHIKVPNKVLDYNGTSHYIDRVEVEGKNKRAILLCDRKDSRCGNVWMDKRIKVNGGKDILIKRRTINALPNCKVCLLLGEGIKRKMREHGVSK